MRELTALQRQMGVAQPKVRRSRINLRSPAKARATNAGKEAATGARRKLLQQQEVGIPAAAVAEMVGPAKPLWSPRDDDRPRTAAAGHASQPLPIPVQKAEDAPGPSAAVQKAPSPRGVAVGKKKGKGSSPSRGPKKGLFARFRAIFNDSDDEE